MTQSVFTADALAGEIVLVTGASRGIGAAILDVCVKAGATVIGTATSDSGAAKISARIQELGGKGEGRVLNIAAREGTDAFMKALEADFGSVTVLVNNAGITRDTLSMRMKDSQWDEVIETNLTGGFRLSRACLKGMMKARHGRIINIASIVGMMGNAGQANYAAAKAGTIAMSKSHRQRNRFPRCYRQLRCARIYRNRYDRRAERCAEASSSCTDSARTLRFCR